MRSHAKLLVLPELKEWSKVKTNCSVWQYQQDLDSLDSSVHLVYSSCH